jgi:hypothetical protein
MSAKMRLGGLLSLMMTGLPAPGCTDDGDGANSGGSTASVQRSCSGLANRSVGGAAIVSSTLRPPAQGAPEYCEVRGDIGSDLQFEVRLPTAWNGKLLYSGGGGWGGMLQLEPADSATGQYVVVGSNGGHKSAMDPPFLDASPFLNDAEAKERFAATAIQMTLTAARAIVQERYGRSIQRTYFKGCSGGGREGLVQANRYPDSFDGLIASAPALSTSRLVVALNMRAHQQARAPVTPAKAELLARSYLTACDALDGLADGIVHNQGACAFRVEALACPAQTTDTTSCLTADELTTAKLALSPVHYRDGTPLYPALPPPSLASSWTAAAGDGGPMPFSLWQAFGDGGVKYWLMSDPNFDTSTFDPDQHRPAIEAMARLIDATPDLTAFFARGGKLILTHGTDDLAISHHDTVQYFQQVATTVGTDTRDASSELFLHPGVQHCQGGTGPDKIDLARALDRWVESDLRPSSTTPVLRKLDQSGQEQLARPMCRYPQFARYRGEGDPRSAASFTCVDAAPPR